MVDVDVTSDLGILIKDLMLNGIEYSRKDYGKFITIDVLDRSYDFKVGGKLVGIYSRQKETA